MKKEDVPQDSGKLGDFKEIVYARDETGRWVLVPTTGWEAKSVANDQSWELINRIRQKVLTEVRAGKKSVLAYYMVYHHLDEKTLAQYVGLPKWRVKRHMKPGIFQKLSDGVIRKYADLFDMSPEDLKKIPESSAPGDPSDH
jgi:hypothetical protein